MTLRIYCPSCFSEIRTDSDICPACGTELNPPGQEDATRRLDTPKQRHKTSSFDSIDDARFVPGAIIAERYRIVGLLGRGGMGEVYRADDLKLSQPVALKFLPDHLLSDGAALARFHREVRVARQVSHKNVCRVYDIGEVDGRHFLSMEFIKGEELAGDFRDPLVGRDVLFGAVIGAAMILIITVSHISPVAFGKPPNLFLAPGNEVLGSTFFARFAGQLSAGLFQAFIAVFLLLLFVLILRRERFAVLALWLLITVLLTLIAETTWMTIPFTGLWAFLMVHALVRFGLLALVSVVFYAHLVVFYPITTELTAWYAIDFTIALAIGIGLAAYGFYISLGGQKLLPGTLLEE